MSWCTSQCSGLNISHAGLRMKLVKPWEKQKHFCCRCSISYHANHLHSNIFLCLCFSVLTRVSGAAGTQQGPVLPHPVSSTLSAVCGLAANRSSYTARVHCWHTQVSLSGDDASSDTLENITFPRCNPCPQTIFKQLWAREECNLETHTYHFQREKNLKHLHYMILS